MPKMWLYIFFVYRRNETITNYENRFITTKEDFKNMDRLGSTYCYKLPRLQN